MPKIDLGKMDVYKFVVCVLAFVLIFCFIFMVQTKAVINFQSKVLERYLDQKPKIPTTTSPYTPTTQKEIEKYENYGY